MPSINLNFLNELKCTLSDYPVFIETGTYLGETIFGMEPYFDKLFTIELSEKYYTNTSAKYKGTKINFLLGDSSTRLKDVFDSVTENCLIFLDGHYSSGDTAKGKKECPLLEEIEQINTYCKGNAIIIIDDCRLLSKGPQDGFAHDWSDINVSKILSILGNKVKRLYFLDSICAKNDRLVIHIG